MKIKNLQLKFIDMLVMKFKGAVLQNQESLTNIKNNILNQHCSCVIVISALKGIMPRLRQLYALSLRQGRGFEEEFKELQNIHEQLACELLTGKKLEEYKVEMKAQLDELYSILHHVAVLKDSSQYMKDYILAKGDILASLLFSKLFPEAIWKDSRNFILTDDNFGAPEVLWEESCNAVKQEFGQLKGIAVVPGYCGKTKDGYTISLGRVGLSLTAAVLESAFQQLKVA